jgi:predicted metal-dependent HD superfamily phosphohydrolase
VFLKSFIKKEAIYYTPYFFDKYELIARKNIERAIKKLSNKNN